MKDIKSFILESSNNKDIIDCLFNILNKLYSNKNASNINITKLCDLLSIKHDDDVIINIPQVADKTYNNAKASIDVFEETLDYMNLEAEIEMNDLNIDLDEASDKFDKLLNSNDYKNAVKEFNSYVHSGKRN